MLERHQAIIRRSALCVTATILLTLGEPAAADMCKYVDRDGNMHYTNVEPEKGWKKVSCGVVSGANDRVEARLQAAFAKVKIGMTMEEVQRIGQVGNACTNWPNQQPPRRLCL